jgi:hypothetical protein
VTQQPGLPEIAEWLVSTGYPFDWTTRVPPPSALRDAVIDAVHADPTGQLHGRELTRSEVERWLTTELPGFTPATEEPTR